ncbi:MAG TPA: hypothetical protein VGK03_10595 [Geothrix sp.]
MPPLVPLLTPLLFAGLLDAGPERLPLPSPQPSPQPMVLQLPLHSPEKGPVDLRLRPDGSLYPVRAGLEVPLRIMGGLREPQTDPGRTLIHFTLEAPIYDARHRALLLPVGTHLVGLVHLLRGEYRFVAFQSLTLPDGRSLAAPEEGFRLGPGTRLTILDGGRATITVARPLRMEAFGTP